MKKSASSLIDSFKTIDIWVHSIMSRFPKTFDLRFYQRFHAFLGAVDPLFLKRCSLLHFKRLLITQFFLEKRIQKRKDCSFCMRLFSIRSNLYLSIIFPVNLAFTADFLSQVLRFLIPSLKKKEVMYEWTSQNPSYHFLHLTFEKMRGPYFTTARVKKLEKQFIQKLKNGGQDVRISTFCPYNHEEGYRQLLLLRNEIHSQDDLPHVWIQFHNRTDHEMTFMIHLLKPQSDRDPCLASIKAHLSNGLRLNCYFDQEIEGKIPLDATIFSLTIPNQWPPFSEQVNILDARERIVKELSHSIGLFRDFNGGLLETQKKRLSSLIKQLSHQILNFSLFYKPLFYGIYPIEKQLSLSNERLQELFHLFSDHLEKNRPLSKTEHLLILSADADQTCLMISKCQTLQKEGKITAYAHLTICLKEYICIIDETTQFLPFWQAALKPKQISSNSSTLRLAFKGGIFHSFSPYYLSQDLNGFTLANLLFEGLLRTDSKGQVVYAGAQAIKESQAQKRYIFKIRPNHWSSGEMVTAFEYEKAWKSYQMQKRIPFFDHLTVCALDADSLQVDSTYPDPFLLEKLTHPVFSPCSCLEEPSNFNGPYLIKKTTQTELILEKNPFYWDVKGLFFDQVRIQFHLCPNATLSLFKKNEIDWIGDPLSFHPPSFHSFSFKHLPWKCPFFIHFNTKEPFLSSSYIRRAFSAVIDRKWICQNFFKGSTPMYTFFDPSISIFAPFKEEGLKKGKKWFLQGLKEAKMTKKCASPLSFAYPEGKHLEAVARYLKKIWEEAFGISICLEKHPWNTLAQNLDQGKYHLSGFFRNLYSRDPLPFFQTFSGSYRNFSRWSNSCYQKILMEAKETSSMQKRHFLIRQLNQLLLEEVPAFPLLSTPYRYITSPYLENYTVTPFVSLDFRFAFLKNTFKNLYRFVIPMNQTEAPHLKRQISDCTSLRRQDFLFQQIQNGKNQKESRKRKRRFYQPLSLKIGSL